MRKGTFFKLGSAQRCHRLGSEKLNFSGKRVGLQHTSDTIAVIRGKNANWRPLLNSNGDFNSLNEENKYTVAVKRGTYL